MNYYWMLIHFNTLYRLLQEIWSNTSWLSLTNTCFIDSRFEILQMEEIIQFGAFERGATKNLLARDATRIKMVTNLCLWATTSQVSPLQIFLQEDTAQVRFPKHFAPVPTITIVHLEYHERKWFPRKLTRR